MRVRQKAQAARHLPAVRGPSLPAEAAAPLADSSRVPLPAATCLELWQQQPRPAIKQ